MAKTVFVVFTINHEKKEPKPVIVVSRERVHEYLKERGGTWCTIHEKDNNILQVTVPFPSKDNPTLVYEADCVDIEE